MRRGSAGCPASRARGALPSTLTFALALCLLTWSAPAAPAREAARQPPESLTLPTSLLGGRQELSALERKRAAAQADLAELEAERAALESELAALTGELDHAERALTAAEAAIVSTNQRLLAGERRLQRSREERDARRRQYVRRFRTRLQLGSAGSAEVLLNAHDIGQFTRGIEYLRIATDQDREAVSDLQQLTADMQQLVARLAATRDRQVDQRLEAAADQERVAEIVAEQEAVRAELVAQEAHTRQVVSTLDAEHRLVRQHVETLAAQTAGIAVPTVRGAPAHGIINKRDGVHLWLRYRSPRELYIVAVNRRDGALQIAKKTPGGVQNGGTYHVLARLRGGTYPIPFDRWQRIAASAVNDARGRVTLRLTIDGVLALEAVDDGSIGGPALTTAGRVGVRGDNTEFFFDDVVLRSLDSNHNEVDRVLLDDFDGYGRGLLTSQHPAAPQSPIWRMTSGSLFTWEGHGWSGKPGYGRPGKDAASHGRNNSAIFRLRTKQADLRDVAIELSLRTRGMVDGPLRR